MKVVNLYDLKQMGNKGGCTIQLIHHFPFGMGLGHLKKDYIEFKRVGIFDGKAVEVIGFVSLLIISLCFSLIHAQESTNQANLIGLQHQVPWFSFLLFLINASMVEEFLYREILWNLVRKLDIRVALTSVLFALAHHPGTIIAWCLYVSLGMFLGLVRYKLDLWGSMGLHLVWNLLVYSLLLF
ncbi:caax amino protease family [Streptococcus pneumoniae]|nr:caax amino protease family [Streptococcus pneumoniae]